MRGVSNPSKSLWTVVGTHIESVGTATPRGTRRAESTTVIECIRALFQPRCRLDVLPGARSLSVEKPYSGLVVLHPEASQVRHVYHQLLACFGAQCIEGVSHLQRLLELRHVVRTIDEYADRQ